MKIVKALLTSSVIAAALLTGCADSKSSNDIKVGDVTIDIDEVRKEYSQNKESLKNYLIETPKPINAMSVDMPGGNIVVEHSGDDKSGLALRYKVFADSEETFKEVDEHIDSVSEVKDNVLVIKLVEAQTKEDFEPWLKKNIPDCRVEYDTYITVPEYVTNYTAVCGAGNIEFSNISGTFFTDLNVGDISFTDTEFTGASTIKCSAGDIKMKNIIYKADTDIKTDVGNITFGLPLSTSGDATITAATGTGDIFITGESNYTTKDEKTEGTSHSLSIESENCNISFTTDTGKINIDK